MATADKVMLPDGSEQNASDLICEGCDKPISQHSCGTGTVTTSTTMGGGSAFKTSPRRKDPKDGPLCPHCGGRLHTNMVGYLQDLECAARQYAVDTGMVSDPFQRISLDGLDDIAKVLAWKDTLKTPITYGKMPSAAGGAGTYAARRTAASKEDAEINGTGKRPKKQQAAAAGERIEDIAAAVVPVTTTEAATEPVKRKPGRPRKVQTTASTPDVPAVVPTVPAPAPSPLAAKQAEAEERRAKRRALLGIGR